MNTQLIEKNWAELKGKIKTKFDKFVDSDLESFKSDLSRIPAQIQKAYGITKEQAEQQYADFKKTVSALIESDTSAAATPAPATTGPVSQAKAADPTPAPLKAVKVG